MSVMDDSELANKDETDVYLYLVDHGFDDSVAKVFEVQDIDGQSFLELSTDDLNRLFPNSLGTVKKVYRLVQLERAKTGSSHASTVIPQTPPLSTSSRRSHDDQDTASISSCSFSSPATPSPCTSASKKFSLPDTWRPGIMYAIEGEGDAEQRKRLTPDIRNAIVRDLVSTMYAHMSRPNKDFCTQVAKQLVGKYSFMRDAGTNVTGYGSWEKKLIERVHNEDKAGRKRSGTSSAPPSKRGRPKAENPILKRYPPLQVADNVDEDEIKALQVELAKDKPRKDVVLPHFKKTFPERRHYVLSTQMSVADLTERYRGFLLPYALEQEVDSILKKKDIVKVATEDWKSKWAPSIITYARTLKSKPIKAALAALESKFTGDEEKDEKHALFLMMALLFKGDPQENLLTIYQECQIADDPSYIAKHGKTAAPFIASFEDTDGTCSYYLCV